MEEIEKEGFNQAFKDLFAGAVGGVAQVLLGEFFVGFFFRILEFEGSVCFCLSFAASDPLFV